MKKNFRVLVAGVALAASLSFMAGSVLPVLAASTTVTADACNVRSEASTSSDSVFSVKRGQKLEVTGSTSADDGYTWYKVSAGGKTGYIRADLVETPDGVVDSDSSTKKTEETKKTEDTNTDTANVTEVTATVTEAGSTDVVSAVVTADTVTVRSGASTSTSKAASAKNGQEVSVSGESTDSEGKVWYQISYTDGDKTVNGYIRSDFLQVTATREEEPTVEESVVEEPVEVAPAQPADYECRFEANSDGIEEWFLYDHINGTKQSINNIYAVMKQSQENTVNVSDNSGTFKIIIIIMSIIILGLIAGIVVLVLKSRNHYENFVDIDRDDDDYDYDNEEDEMETDYEEETDDYYAEEEEEEEYVRPKKLGRGLKKKDRRSKRGAFDFDDEDDEDDDSYQRPTRRGSRSYNTEDEAWSTAGMLDIDDDMEFEFLDLDK